MSNTDDFQRAADWLQDEIDYDVTELSMLVLEECENRTPIDTGRLKGNWITSINQPTDRVRDVGETTNPKALAKAVMRRAIKSGKEINVVYVQNNLPYAGIIDDGLYPNPPKKGSWVKGEGWQILTRGGYSLQFNGGISDIAIKTALERSK